MPSSTTTGEQQRPPPRTTQEEGVEKKKDRGGGAAAAESKSLVDHQDEERFIVTTTAKVDNNKEEEEEDLSLLLDCFFGAYFAILPAHPSVSPTVLLEVCQQLVCDDIQVEWWFHRTCELVHPQLSEPLKFLEISGKVPSEAVCDEIVEALLNHSRYSSIIGNVELLLVLPQKLIPILDTDVPMDGSASSFDKYGLVGMQNAIPIDNDDHDMIDQLRDYTMKVFERLYAQLQTKPSRHYKEIMQRDEHRFDFRLDLQMNDLDEDETAMNHRPCSCWERLEQESTWTNLVEDILGADYVRVKCGCVVSLPGAQEQYWHSDGVHVGPDASATLGSTSSCAPPHALCVFVPLIDLTLETGYTEFWSGSHKYNQLLSKKGEQALPGGTLGLLSVGDVLLYDYRVIHRGMPNRSNTARPICYYLYVRKGYETVEDQNFTVESVWD